MDFDFRPHPWVRGGHAQTLFAYLMPGRRFPYRATAHHVRLRDGDSVVLHDDTPDGWQPGGAVAVVLHGIAGCHDSAYVNRAAGKLNRAGVRTFRMDLRGSGAGVGLARRPYHAGRSDDLADAVEHVARLCPGSPLSLVGFSLSGNIVLKYLGERPDAVSPNVVSAVAICPAADLPESQIELRRTLPAFYDRYFTGLLVKQFAQYAEHIPNEVRSRLGRPRRLRDFDEAVTAPLWGYAGAAEYYETVSAIQWLHDVRVPTLLLAAKDDPIIPVRSFESAAASESVRIVLTESGGHLGFLGRRDGGDPDRRWMDWRVVDWVTQGIGQGADPVGSATRPSIVRPRRIARMAEYDEPEFATAGEHSTAE